MVLSERPKHGLLSRKHRVSHIRFFVKEHSWYSAGKHATKFNKIFYMDMEELMQGTLSEWKWTNKIIHIRCKIFWENLMQKIWKDSVIHVRQVTSTLKGIKFYEVLIELNGLYGMDQELRLLRTREWHKETSLKIKNRTGKWKQNTLRNN